eukprot:12340463-Karenia_brevis.AAC.1
MLLQSVQRLETLAWTKHTRSALQGVPAWLGGLAHDTPSKECLLAQLPGASCSSAQSKAGAREGERANWQGSRELGREGHLAGMGWT